MTSQRGLNSEGCPEGSEGCLEGAKGWTEGSEYQPERGRTYGWNFSHSTGLHSLPVPLVKNWSTAKELLTI